MLPCEIRYVRVKPSFALKRRQYLECWRNVDGGDTFPAYFYWTAAPQCWALHNTCACWMNSVAFFRAQISLTVHENKHGIKTAAGIPPLCRSIAVHCDNMTFWSQSRPVFASFRALWFVPHLDFNWTSVVSHKSLYRKAGETDFLNGRFDYFVSSKVMTLVFNDNIRVSLYQTKSTCITQVYTVILHWSQLMGFRPPPHLRLVKIP